MGGALDFSFQTVSDTADKILEQDDSPLYVELAAHLREVSTTLREVEKVLSGDSLEGSETSSILALLGPTSFRSVPESQHAVRQTMVEAMAHAAFGVMWSKDPDNFGPSFDHDHDLFVEIIEASLAAASELQLKIVPGVVTPELIEVGTQATLEPVQRPVDDIKTLYEVMVEVADLARKE